MIKPKTAPLGSKVKGKIKNLVPYGAFVEIEEVSNVYHASELSGRNGYAASDVLTIGPELKQSS